jgi:outer membrane protein TolC
MNRIIKRALIAATLAAMSGCSSVPKDAGFDEVRQTLATRLDGAVEWRRGGAEDAEADRRVAEILDQPLTADAAVQVALLNNRLLQAEYEELGVAQADLVQAGLLHNPSFGWSRQEGGDITKTTWGVEVDFLGLLLAAPKERIEGIRFEHAKLRVSQAVLRHAMETRKAWYEALAAEQSAGFMAQVADLAVAEAELGDRQLQAGNISRRDALRKQVFAADNRATLAHAREMAFAARERLNRLMGVWGEQTSWKLPARLPELPATRPEFADIEAYGLTRRLDLQMAQKEAEALAAGLKLTRETRFINVFELGVETESASGERRITGPNLKFELPIFDQGRARISKQEAQYRQSEARLYALAVDARSQIRECAQRAITAYATAKQRQDVLLPMHRQLVEQSTLHYNGMLIGVYELLADARAQIDAVRSHIEATRDFWSALADVQLAIGGRLPQATAEWVAPVQEPTGAATPHFHMEHAQ